jgi:hypothetical protein
VDCSDLLSLVVDEDWVVVPSNKASLCSQQAIVANDASEAEVFDEFPFFVGSDGVWLREDASADWCCW